MNNKTCRTNDWSSVPLASCLLSRPSYGINAPSIPYDDRYPTYLRITDIDDSGRAFSSGRTSVDHPQSTQYLLGDNEIVLARTGASVGKSYIHRDFGEPIVYAGFLIRLRPDVSRIDPRFLASFLMTAEYWRWVKMMSMRSGQPGINGSEYAQLQVPLPPLPEQRAIAEALSDVDDLINCLDQLIAKKRAIKQATMQQLLTGKTRLPGFSGEWSVRRFGEIATLRKDKIDPRRTNAYSECVELENLSQGTSQLLGMEPLAGKASIKSVFHKDDVLFGKLRSYLRKHWLCDRDGVCSTEIWCFVANRSLVSSRYLFHIVTSDSFIDAASTTHGTHMPRSDWKIVQQYQTRLPNIEEQVALAQILDDIDAEVEALERRRNKGRLLKQGMMQELLTGKTRLV